MHLDQWQLRSPLQLLLLLDIIPFCISKTSSDLFALHLNENVCAVLRNIPKAYNFFICISLCQYFVVMLLYSKLHIMIRHWVSRPYIKLIAVWIYVSDALDSYFYFLQFIKLSSYISFQDIMRFFFFICLIFLPFLISCHNCPLKRYLKFYFK